MSDEFVVILPNELQTDTEQMATGSFASSTGTSLNLYVEYSTTAGSGYTDVTCSVYLRSYAVSSSNLTGNYISIGGTQYSYNGSQSYTGSSQTTRLMGTATRRISHTSATTITLSVAWVFNGTYAGTYLGTITASASITLASTSVIPGKPGIPTLAGKFEIGEIMTLTYTNGSNAASHNIAAQYWVPDVGWTNWETVGVGKSLVITSAMVTGRTAIRVRVESVSSSGVRGEWSAESNYINHYGVRVWNGSAWKWGTVKAWNGSSWVESRVRRWSGSDWTLAK